MSRHAPCTDAGATDSAQLEWNLLPRGSVVRRAVSSGANTIQLGANPAMEQTEDMMWSRRQFLGTVAAGFAAPALSRNWFESQNEMRTALNGPVGLQLWSLREYLPKDLTGTLTKVRALGFREVEGAGLWKHTAAELRAALDSAGLRCQSAHMGFERLRDDGAGAFAEARAIGASW